MAATKPSETLAWLPVELLNHARQLTCGEFRLLSGSHFFLAILLDGLPPELAQGLTSSDAAGYDGIPYRTEGTSDEIKVPPERGDAHEAQLRSLAELISRRCYFARVQKRGQAVAFRSQISVGRARNNDIVLRHPSVSKSHATFAVDDGNLTIKDMGSRNHTLLNGAMADANAPVHANDRMKFGDVQAIVVDADALWRALQHAR